MKITSIIGTAYRLRKREVEWCASVNSRRMEALACIRYALVYAHRHSGWFLGVCRPDVDYTTQLVNKHHKGVEEVKAVLERRVADPDLSAESDNRPFFELARMPDGMPCVLMHQRTSRYDIGIGRPAFWTCFQCDDSGMVRSIRSGALPSPVDLDRSGLFPGVPADVLRRQKKRKPEVLPAGVPLTFIYLHAKEDKDWAASAAAVKDVMGFFPLATLEVIPLALDTTDEKDVVWLNKKGVQALPHLHVRCYEDDVIHLDGPFDRDRLMQEIYPRFNAPCGTPVETGRMTAVLKDESPGMGCTYKARWYYYCDPTRMEEIVEAFTGDDQLAAQRAGYLLDRLSLIKREVIQPLTELLINFSHEDTNAARLRHVARMLPRLDLTQTQRQKAEQLLLNMAWHSRDTALQIFALRSLRHFAKQNFKLREFGGPFVFKLMRRARNGRVVREAEVTLDTIEYFEEKVHEQWDRQMAHA